MRGRHIAIERLRGATVEQRLARGLHARSDRLRAARGVDRGARVDQRERLAGRRPAGRAQTIKEGVQLAREALSDGRAAEALERYVQMSRSCAAAEAAP